MDEDIKKNIFYQPNINIERRYDTNGKIFKSVSPDDSNTTGNNKTTENEDIYDRAVKVGEQLLRIRSVMKILPEDTVKIIQDIVDKAIFDNEIKKEEIKKIIDQDKKDEEDNKRVDVYPNDTSSEATDDATPSSNSEFWEDPDPIDVTINVVRRKDDSELANEQYLADSTKIKEDFSYKLNNVFQDYIYPLMTVMGEVGLNSITYLNLDYEGESITGVQTDDKHLHDTIVRNQTIMDEKNRKFAKTHGTNMTLAVMTAFDVVAQERTRYYSEEYDIGLNSFAGMYKRNILEETKKEYDDKYMKAKMNMYKYMDSAVTITDDILKSSLRSNVAKCYLLTQDVNIYARKDYESVSYQNTTDDTMNDLEKTGTVGSMKSASTSTSGSSSATTSNSTSSSTTSKTSSSNSTSNKVTTTSSSNKKDSLLQGALNDLTSATIK